MRLFYKLWIPLKRPAQHESSWPSWPGQNEVRETNLPHGGISNYKYLDHFSSSPFMPKMVILDTDSILTRSTMVEYQPYYVLIQIFYALAVFWIGCCNIKKDLIVCSQLTVLFFFNSTLSFISNNLIVKLKKYFDSNTNFLFAWN